jgi:hypothetical protein
MPQPIKVRGRFATARDTARTLGVSASRTRELIDAVRKFTERLRESKNGTVAAYKRMKNSPAPAVKMNKSRRHAEATKKKIQAHPIKAHR